MCNNKQTNQMLVAYCITWLEMLIFFLLFVIIELVCRRKFVKWLILTHI